MAQDLPATTGPMDEKQARACVSLIQNHIKNARAQILELYQRDGWKALGYESWSQCVVEEFGKSKSYLYRQLAAARVELLICPTGTVGDMKEAKLRPLTALPEEEVAPVWDQASVNGAISPTTARVTELANKALAGLTPDEKVAEIEDSEEQIIRRTERQRRQETTKDLLLWLEKMFSRALRKITLSGLNLKPLPQRIKRMQAEIPVLRARLLGRKVKADVS